MLTSAAKLLSALTSCPRLDPRLDPRLSVAVGPVLGAAGAALGAGLELASRGLALEMEPLEACLPPCLPPSWYTDHLTAVLPPPPQPDFAGKLDSSSPVPITNVSCFLFFFF